MNWTKEPPTETGFYWVSFNNYGISDLVYVRHNLVWPDLPQSRGSMNLDFFISRGKNTSWYGPLIMPKGAPVDLD